MRYRAKCKALDNTEYTIYLGNPTYEHGEEIFHEGWLKMTADEPFIIEQKSNDLFSNVKAKECTIKILSDTYLFDIYDVTGKGYPMMIYRTGYNEQGTMVYNELYFYGYIEPNIYNQDFTHIDEIEIVAVEAISTLQYYDFNPITANGYDDINNEYKIVSLYAVLKNLLWVKCGYSGMVVQQDLKLGENIDVDVLKNISINELNFYSDDGEYYNENGNARFVADPMKCDEVLESVLKYLNLTLTLYKGIPYLINYNAMNEIEQGDTNTFKMYRFSNNNETFSQPVDFKTVTLENFKDGTPKLSLTETYNRVNLEANYLDIDDEQIVSEQFNNRQLEQDPTTTLVSGEYKWNERTNYVHEDIIGFRHGNTAIYSVFQYDYIKFRNTKWKTYNYILPQYGLNQTDEPNCIFYNFFPTKWPTTLPAMILGGIGMHLDSTISPENALTQTDGEGVIDMWKKSDSSYYYRYAQHGILGNNTFGDSSTEWGKYDEKTLSAIPEASVFNLFYDRNFNACYQNLGCSFLRVWESNTINTPKKTDWGEYMIFGLGLPGCILNNMKYKNTESSYYRDFYNLVERQISGSLTEFSGTMKSGLNWYYATNNIVLAEYDSETDVIFNSSSVSNFIVINGKVMYSTFYNMPTEKLAAEDDAPDYMKSFKLIDGTEFLEGWGNFATLMAEIKVGDYYYREDYEDTFGTGSWTATNKRWSTEPGKIYILAGKDKSFYANEWMDFTTTSKYTDNIDEDGMAIKIKTTDKSVKGKLHIKFFTPHIYPQGYNITLSPSGNFDYECRTIPRWVFVKDFSVKYVSQGTRWSDTTYDEDKADIKFSNVVVSGSAIDAPEVKLEINTQSSSSKYRLSSAIGNIQAYTANYPYITQLYSYSLDKTEQPEFLILEQ